MAVAKPPAIQPIGARSTQIKMMLVAPPGFGKTVFGASGDRVLFLTADPEGTESAYFMGLEADEWIAPSADEVYDCYAWLLKGGHKSYDWIVVDTVGFTQKHFLRKSMDNGIKRNPNRDEFVPGLDDHQRSQLEIESFVKRLNELPMNVLWLAHQELNEDENGDTFFSPAIHGQKGAVAQTVAGLMKIVGYGEEVESEDDKPNIRRIWFSRHGPFRGKDRTNSLGAYRDGLTLLKMEEIVERKKRSVRKPSSTTKQPTNAAPKTATRAKRVATSRKK